MSKPATMKELVFQALDNLPAMLEWEKIQAKQIRAKYEALCKEGFTEQQALDLCKVWRT
ncbi:MAG: hypothetical protein PHG89_10875 [Gallionella sp.]|nr:hypothetical protein [Gallionella sp.]